MEQDEALDDVVVDLLASSDEDEGKRAGSHKGKAPNLERGREASSKQLHRAYLADACTYSPHILQLHFRETRTIFLGITERLSAFDPVLQTRADCTKTKGLDVYPKCTAAMRMLEYSCVGDAVDE